MKNLKFNFKSIVKRKTRWLITLIAILTLGMGQMWATKTVWIDVTGQPWDGSTPYSSGMMVQYYNGSYAKVWASSYGTINGKQIWKAEIPDNATKWEVLRGSALTDGSYYNWQGELTYATYNKYTVTGWDKSGSASQVIGMVTGGYMYYDDHLSNWDGSAYKYFVIGHDSYYGNTQITTTIANTKLWYLNNNSAAWPDAKYFAFIAHTGEYPSASKAWSDIDTYAAHKTAQYTSNYNLVNNGHYLCVPSASGDRQSFTISSKSAYTDLNHRITIKEKYNSSGSTPWAEVNAGTTHGTISAAGYKFGSWTACNTESSATVTKETTTYSAYADFGYTNTVRLTADATKAGKAFVGWYDNSGTQLTTSTTYDLVVTGATTVWAYYKDEETHDVTVSYKCSSDVIKTAATESAVGVSTTRTVTAPTLDDYVFSSWSLGSDVISTNGTSTNPIIIKTRASGSTFTLTANYTRKTCKLYEPSGPKSGSSTDRGVMSYSLSEKAYYKDVTADSYGKYYFRFYHNGATEYSSGWEGDYVSGKRAYANGDKIVCDQSVGGWDDRPAMYFQGIASSNIRIWFDYANKRAWVTETTYAVTVNNGANGTVSPNGSQSVGPNSGKSITATPATGWKFVSWSKTGSAVLSSTSTNPTTVTATGTGSVTPTYAHRYILRGSTIENDATTAGMAGWSANDNSSYATATISDGVMTITANLTKAKTPYKCQIRDIVDNVYKGQTGTDEIPNNTPWTLNGSNDVKFTTTCAGTYTFTYNCSNASFKLVWPTSYTITYGVNGTGGTATATVSGETVGTSPGYAQAGSTVRFTATPSTGYEFTKWVNESGTQLSTNNPYDISSLAANKTVKAVFTAKTYDDGVLDKNGGSSDGSYTVTYNATSITPSAPTKTGYHVEGYYTNAGCSIKVATPAGVLEKNKAGYTDADGHWNYDGTKTLTAKWEANTYTGSENLNKTIGGTHGQFTATYNATTIAINTTPTKTGYDVEGYYKTYTTSPDTWTTKVATPAGALQPSTGYTDATNHWTNDGNVTLYTKWSAHTYTVTLTPGEGGSGSNGTMTVDYDATAYKTFSHSITQTGYHINGWYDNSESLKVLDADGTFAGSSISGYITSSKWTKAADCTLQAWWDPNNYAVTLDQQTSADGYSASGTVGNQSVYYNTALPSITGTAPTAINGWAFMGFYSSTGGEGVQVIDGSLNWVASAEGYTDADSKWIHVGDATLYAYYQKAEFTTLEHNATVAKGDVVTLDVNPVLNVTPADYTAICWTLHYSENDNEVPTSGDHYYAVDSYTESGAKPLQVRFTMTNLAVGSYYVKAVLKASASSSFNPCSTGTLLDTETSDFRIVGSSTVTINYQYYFTGDVIASSGSVEIEAESSAAITAPEIIGYSFREWSLGAGVTKVSGNLTDATITISSTYDGVVTAFYNKKQMIYFNNTLGWEDVWVYFYNDGGGNEYWTNGYGTGANKQQVFNYQHPYWETEHGQMTQIEGTNIWYFDYKAAGYNTTRTKVAFANKNQSIDKTGASDAEAYFHDASVVYRTDFDASNLSMFVPIDAVKHDYTSNTGSKYYHGYWINYPENTGYTLKIFDGKGGSASFVKDQVFTHNANKSMPMSISMELTGGTTYGFKIYRNDVKWYGNSGTMTNGSSGDGTQTVWEFTTEASSNCGLTTTSSGIYTFTLSYGKDANENYNYLVGVRYPESVGDFRLQYKDDINSTWKTSSVIPAVTESDTISYFVRKASTPYIRVQKCTAVDGSGNPTWTNVNSGNNILPNPLPDAITADGVYNFIFSKSGDDLVLSEVEPYTGNFYIRVGEAGSTSWDIYHTADHIMPYSEYSMGQTTDPYSHYFTKYYRTINDDGSAASPSSINIRFVVANDYSTNISDTITSDGTGTSYVNSSGILSGNNANIRFMYNYKTNVATRRYLDDAQGPRATDFLLLIPSNNTSIWDAATDGNAYTQVQLSDKGNWVYEANVWVVPGTTYQLKATFGRGSSITLYLKGAESGEHQYETLIGGSGSSRLQIRLIYDYKTNRVLAAYIPSSGTIDENLEINADIMFVREHQGNVTQISFGEDKSISEIHNVYSVLRFNKSTINDLSLSRYERDIFYVSFPYDVRVSDIIGFGTYGTHWIIEYYDGADRAAKGFWKDSKSFWKFITPAMASSYVLKAGTGYIVALDLDRMDNYSTIWANTSTVELIFPGDISSISNQEVTYNMPSHQCNIGPRWEGASDRRIKDSHWNILGVPTYHNTTGSFANHTDEIGNKEQVWSADGKPKYLYTWNMTDNSLTVTDATDYNYKAMHAYVVQYYGDVTFHTSTNAVPAIVARRTYAEAPSEVTFRMEIQQNDQMVDHTFVTLSNDETVSNEFVFGEDISKEFNANKANIYSMVTSILNDTATVTEVAGNTLPMSNQTMVVPVGVDVNTTGDYTFSIPDGTNGIGVTLIDNETGIRTSLTALDYTVNLTAGTHEGRFLLEISPIHNAPTGVEAVTDDGLPVTGARKVLIDGILYIVKGDKLYDVRGTMIK